MPNDHPKKDIMLIKVTMIARMFRMASMLICRFLEVTKSIANDMSKLIPIPWIAFETKIPLMCRKGNVSKLDMNPYKVPSL